MIDLHCHILPGVDDGALNDDDAINLLKIAINDGITHMVLTPHVQPGRYENNLLTLKEPFLKLQNLVKGLNLPITLGIAGEVRLCTEILELHPAKKLPFIGRWGNQDVMLLEFPHSGIPPGSDKLVDWLIDRKILPMIVHPERNKAIMTNLDKVIPFIDKGCLFQLTAMSITGDFGAKAYEVAHQFLENNWTSIVASDAHNVTRRPPILSKAYDLIKHQYDADLAQRLFIDTPSQIINF